MSKKTKEMTLGADPEIFVVKGNGELLPAFTFLPSKYDPVKTDEPGGGGCYWDGVQSEFQVKPSTNIAEVLTSISFGLRKILEMARKIDPNARFSTKTVVDTPVDWLATLAPEYVEFGCMPSFNAYEIEGEKLDGKDCPTRFSGGHVHMGIGAQTEETLCNVVKALDVVLGIPSISLFQTLDNPIRRHYYGLCGEFRVPQYPNGMRGLEYRTLSNAWVFNPDVGKFVFDLARKTAAAALKGWNGWKMEQSEVIETILLCDAEKARGIMAKKMDGWFKDIGFTSSVDFFKPIETSFNMNDIEANWGIV